MIRKIRLSIRNDIVNKAETKQDQQKLGKGWNNVEITIDELIAHIQSGFAIAHQFAGGHKAADGFLCADLLIADIDNKSDPHHFKLDDAQNHPFIAQYASFIYTTPSHQSDHHRFRVIFVLENRLFNGSSYEALYDELLQLVPTDPSTRSCAQPFFGSKDCEVIRINKTLDEKIVNEMIAKTMDRRHKAAFPLEPEPIEKHTFVQIKNGGRYELWSLPDKTSIHCPFGTHVDRHASAFVKSNKQGARGVECRSCGHSAWTGPLELDYSQFSSFEQYVLKHAGKKNSHFDYQGFSRWDHEIDASMGSENFHVSNNEHLVLPQLEPGIHLIKSAKGTGKTEALTSLAYDLKDPRKRKQFGLTPQSRMILVGHRQSLIQQSAQRLGFDCYLDTAAWDTKLDIHRDFTGKVIKVVSRKPMNYAVCLDSLHSRINFNHEKYDVVILDESEQVFSHFLSEYMDNPVQNFKVLSELIRNAKYVYCLDADLDRITVTGVVACETGTPIQRHMDELKKRSSRLQKIYFHLNTYHPDPGEIQVFDNKLHLLDDFRRAVQAGKKCMFVSNSKKFVTEQHAVFTSAFKDKSFVLITSDTSSDPDIKRFIANIKTKILDHDVVFASPTIGTGVDITFPDRARLIDCVYGFFESEVNTHFDIDQQLYRVRHPQEIKVWINPRISRSRLSRETIRREIYDGNKVPHLRFEVDVDGVSVPDSHIPWYPFMELVAEIMSVQRRSMNNLKGNFISHRQRTGWTVTTVAKDENLAKKGAVVSKAGRVSRKTSDRERLLASRKLSFKERFQLQEREKKNESISIEERTALKRYWIEHFYKTELTPELITYDNDGKTREKIRLLENVINPKIPYLSLKEIPSELLGSPHGSKILAGNIDPNAAVVIKGVELKKIVFLRETFMHAGIFDPQRLDFLLGVEYQTSTLSNFVGFLKNHRDTFEFIFEKSINDHLDERPASQVGSLLRLVGLNHKPVRLNKGVGTGPSTYAINAVAYQQTMSIVERRKIQLKNPENSPDG